MAELSWALLDTAQAVVRYDTDISAKNSCNMEWIWCRTWTQIVMQGVRSTWYHSLQVRTRIKHRNAFIKRVRMKLLSCFIRQWFVIRAKFEIQHSGWFVRRSSRNCRFTICIHTSRYVKRLIRQNQSDSNHVSTVWDNPKPPFDNPLQAPRLIS